MTVAKMADETADNEPVSSRAKWGLALRDLTPAERAKRKLDDEQGVLVTGVAPGSPAAEAGIKPGDVIIEANRQPVGSAKALHDQAAGVAEGKPLLLLVHPADGNDRFAALTQ
ncbi:MAG: PDZ domain-containing protein [Deltaproteobacteria bacterium]|nr:PDZ domain-containing protein [Deltaproteobacteria bacterium]